MIITKNYLEKLLHVEIVRNTVSYKIVTYMLESCSTLVLVLGFRDLGKILVLAQSTHLTEKIEVAFCQEVNRHPRHIDNLLHYLQ